MKLSLTRSSILQKSIIFKSKFLSFIILTLVFSSKISYSQPVTAYVKVALEGIVNINFGHTVTDTVTIYLSKTLYPEIKLDSAKSVIDKFTLNGTFVFARQNENGHYYLYVKHRNSIKTWSQPVYIKFGTGFIFYYDFSNKITQAFGNNMVFKNGRYCIYSGDVDQDGSIDADDVSSIENAATRLLTGYNVNDLNFDNITDAADVSIAENNLHNGVESKIPYLLNPVRDDLPNKSDINRDVMLLPYTSVIYRNGVFSMYYRTNNIVKLDTSLDGKTWRFKKNVSVNQNGTPTAGDSLQSTIRRGNKWYSTWTAHTGSGSTYTEWFNVATSTNGYNFTQYSGNPLPFNPGEDHTLFDNTDSFYCYIRPDIPSIDPRRKVGLMKSYNFYVWTDIETIIQFPDSEYNNPASQLYLKQPYNMNVIRNGEDWWGFMHVIRIEDDGTEDWNYPYTGLEETVETHLMHSFNGRDWKFTNNKKAFVPIHDSVKQVYALPTLVNDSLYIYSFESTLRHAGYSLEYQGLEAYNFAKGKYWKIFLYKIALADLNLWKP